jgi:hypothetical protein
MGSVVASFKPRGVSGRLHLLSRCSHGKTGRPALASSRAVRPAIDNIRGAFICLAPIFRSKAGRFGDECAAVLRLAVCAMSIHLARLFEPLATPEGRVPTSPRIGRSRAPALEIFLSK